MFDLGGSDCILVRKHDNIHIDEKLLVTILKGLDALIHIQECVCDKKIDITYNKISSTPVATPTKPESKDVITDGSSAGYSKIDIEQDIGRPVRRLNVINDGPGDIYIYYRSTDNIWNNEEILVQDSEYTTLYNVVEIRIRSVKKGCQFRLTESGYSNIKVNVQKSERIESISTDKDTHFTESIDQYYKEDEDISGLISNKVFIRGINIQSIQPLKYRLIFWSKENTKDSTDLDNDTYISDVILDLSDTTSAFRIKDSGGSFNQYYLDMTGLNIPYEDKDSNYKLHLSLQNLSVTSKNAGSTGAVQIDIKYAPRL